MRNDLDAALVGKTITSFKIDNERYQIRFETTSGPVTLRVVGD